MQTYNYEGLDVEGVRHRGQIVAKSVSAAIGQLEAEGWSILSISAANPSESGSAASYRLRLSRLVEEKSTWLPALQALTEELPKSSTRRETAKLLKRVEAVESADDLLASPDAISLLPLINSASDSRANVQRLRDWFEDIASQQERQSRRRKRLIYPAMLMLLASIILIAFSLGIAPIFRQMFSEFGLGLPAPTLLAFWVAEQISRYFVRTIVVLLLALAIAIPSVKLWRKQALTNRLLGSFVAGTTSNLRAMSTLVGTLAELMSLGAPLTEALKTSGYACRHRYFDDAAQQLSASLISRSPTLSATARRLPPLVIETISGDLKDESRVALLRELANIYGDRARARLDLLTDGLPAFAILLVGASVGFLVIALFMPLVTMITALS